MISRHLQFHKHLGQEILEKHEDKTSIIMTIFKQLPISD